MQVADTAALLTRLVTKPHVDAPVASQPQDQAGVIETDIAERGVKDESPNFTTLSVPSGFACPDCHGVWEAKDGDLVRFRCRVGHAYLPESIRSARSEKLEEALWIAFRSL